MSGSIKWDKRFMKLTEEVAEWSSCYQSNRHVGAVIVKDKHVITTGYNGAPAGVESCVETRTLLCRSRRTKRNYPSGETRRFRCWRYALLHAPALHHLR